ncbi:aspartate aminotransferase family protein [Rossellomorea sp. BNER]|uniref:aspartate aminotransferase family protein n=1 Tax=Rossellomorea sp. BNER TaxID=2962031 RepID=UPI003AF25B0F|nr:aspartate aminotransferase family protein [Rossellomorea sp. BNER]
MPHSHLIKPVLNDTYPEIDYGKGVYLYDKEGTQYFDACSGAVTANIGHGMEEIVQAITTQANRVSFVYRSQFSNEPAEELANHLASETDFPWCFFVNSGSEAVETAIKIAVQHWQEKGYASKTKVLSRWLSYHGITLGALSASGHPARRERFHSIIGDWPVVEPPYCYQCPFEKKFPDCNLHCARQLETMIKRMGPANIAAFIAEPIIGAAGGAIDPPEGYYQKIKEICDKYDILFIADEVMTGCGRTGKFLAIDHWGVKPDIVALGKGLSAGYSPIAATMISENVMKPIIEGSNIVMGGHTYSANPLSSSAALSVLKLIQSEKWIEKVEEKSIYLQHYLKKLKNEFSFIDDIRGKGFLLGMEFKNNWNVLKAEVDASFTSYVVKEAQAGGVLLYPAGAGLDGKSGSAIIIAPPLTTTKREIEELYRRLRSIFSIISNKVALQ